MRTGTGGLTRVSCEWDGTASPELFLAGLWHRAALWKVKIKAPFCMQTIYYLSVRMQPCSYHVSLSGFVRRLLRSGLRIVGSLETDVACDRGGPWRRVYWGGAGWGSCWHCWSARRGREPDIRCIHAAEYGSRYYNITQSGRRGFFLNIKMLKYVHSEGKVTFFSWNEIFCFNIQYLFGTYERMRELKVGNKIKRTVRYFSVFNIWYLTPLPMLQTS